MSDDETLIKPLLSLRIIFYLFVLTSYLISVILMFYTFKSFVEINVMIFLTLFSSLFYQVLGLKKNDTKNYLKLFKFNNYSGLILFLGIVSANL